MFAFVKQIRKALCWTLFLWKLLVVESNWLLCQDAVESGLGRIDYERKEKGFIAADRLGGEGRWKGEEKAGECRRKKRLRRKYFKRLDLLKIGFQALWQTDLFRTCSVFLLIIVWYLYAKCDRGQRNSYNGGKSTLALFTQFLKCPWHNLY